MSIHWTRTVVCSGVPPHELQSALARLAATVHAACRARFPGARYLHRVEHDDGVVQGRRFHVERRGFKGVVAVQWYPRTHSYRRARDGGLEVRIGGQARVDDLEPTPLHTELDPHVHGRVLGLGVAAVLGLGGVQTVRLVMRYPSFTPVLDVLGIALAVLAVCAAVWLLRVAALRRWWQRRPTSSRVRPLGDEAASDIARWRALGRDLDRIEIDSRSAP